MGPQRVGGPKFRAFFFRLSPPVLLFFSLLGVFFVEFWWCFLKRRGRELCTFGVLGLLCEAPAAPKPPGFYTTAREPTDGPGLHRNHQNSTKRPKREKKNEIGGGDGNKKSEILGVRWRGSAQGGPNQEPQHEPQSTPTKMDWPKLDRPKLDWPKSALTVVCWECCVLVCVCGGGGGGGGGGEEREGFWPAISLKQQIAFACVEVWFCLTFKVREGWQSVDGQVHFHPNAKKNSSKKVQNHFHPKTVSSNDITLNPKNPKTLNPKHLNT